MPSACSLRDLKLIQISIKDSRKAVRSYGESRNVQPQRNMKEKTVNYVGIPGSPVESF